MLCNKFVRRCIDYTTFYLYHECDLTAILYENAVKWNAFMGKNFSFLFFHILGLKRQGMRCTHMNSKLKEQMRCLLLSRILAIR